MHNLGQQIAQQHEQTGATMMVKALHVYMYIDTHTDMEPSKFESILCKGRQNLTAPSQLSGTHLLAIMEEIVVSKNCTCDP